MDLRTGHVVGTEQSVFESKELAKKNVENL
jgi:hypothetical protein